MGRVRKRERKEEGGRREVREGGREWMGRGVGDGESEEERGVREGGEVKGGERWTERRKMRDRDGEKERRDGNAIDVHVSRSLYPKKPAV